LKVVCMLAIFLLVILSLGFLLSLFKRTKGVVDKIIKHLFKFFKIYWYIVVMLPITMYILDNWRKSIDFTGLENIDGNNLLFIFWLALLVLPLLRIKYKDTQIGMFDEDRAKKDDEIAKLNEEIGKIKASESVGKGGDE